MAQSMFFNPGKPDPRYGGGAIGNAVGQALGGQMQPAVMPQQSPPFMAPGGNTGIMPPTMQAGGMAQPQGFGLGGFGGDGLGGQRGQGHGMGGAYGGQGHQGYGGFRGGYDWSGQTDPMSAWKNGFR